MHRQSATAHAPKGQQDIYKGHNGLLFYAAKNTVKVSWAVTADLCPRPLVVI